MSANRSLCSLYNLSVDDAWLTREERELTSRAKYDLDNAAITLKHTGDTQSAIVQSHEASEKLLKAALSRAGEGRNLKKFGHDVPKVFAALLRLAPRYSLLSKPIANLQRLAPSMDLRYSHIPRSLEMAVEAYHGSLYVCGTIAQMWVFDHDRGTSNSKFKECSFYVDGTGATYYCKRASDKYVTLTFFRSSAKLGSQMADIITDPNQSGLYLEVTDSVEDARLRALFSLHLRHPGTAVSPKEIDLNIVDGPEGSYVTSVIRMPIAKKPKS